jgi:hypothetical protein
MNSAADRFFRPRRRASVSPKLLPKLANKSQFVDGPRIPLFDQGFKIEMYLPGGERSATAGSQAGPS